MDSDGLVDIVGREAARTQATDAMKRLAAKGQVQWILPTGIEAPLSADVALVYATAEQNIALVSIFQQLKRIADALERGKSE